MPNLLSIETDRKVSGVTAFLFLYHKVLFLRNFPDGC